MAVGAHYRPWRDEFPEVRLVDGDLLFQQSRLWMEGARIAEADGWSRFVCLDADVVFGDADWMLRVREAFERAPLIQPFETALHLYDDARVERQSIVQWYDDGPGVRFATGLGVGFDSAFLAGIGLYEFAIVGGGDKLLWDIVRWVLPLPTPSDRRDRVVALLGRAGYPENAALHESVWQWVERGQGEYSALRPDCARGVHVVAMPQGSKGNRAYRSRYELLRAFDPNRDLVAPPGQGLSFAPGAEQLKADVGGYLRTRAI